MPALGPAALAWRDSVYLLFDVPRGFGFAGGFADVLADFPAAPDARVADAALARVFFAGGGETTCSFRAGFFLPS
jgi:hypothetical protein